MRRNGRYPEGTISEANGQDKATESLIATRRAGLLRRRRPKIRGRSPVPQVCRSTRKGIRVALAETTNARRGIPGIRSLGLGQILGGHVPLGLRQLELGPETVD